MSLPILSVYFLLVLIISLEGTEKSIEASYLDDFSFLQQPPGFQNINEGASLDVVTYPVVLYPHRKTKLYAEINRPVEKINYKMGDSFNDQDVLLTLKNDKYLANYEKAKSFFDKAIAELTATQELYKERIASDFELKDAKAKLAEAKADLMIAQSDLDATTIKAPYSGRVVSLYVQEHELPPDNKQLIEVIDDTILVAKLLFNAENLNTIKIGEKIEIDISSISGKIDATISRVGAMIDPSSNTIKVEAEIDNRKGLLKAGMVGVAKIPLANNYHR